jgi:hypothetical protein
LLSFPSAFKPAVPDGALKHGAVAMHKPEALRWPLFAVTSLASGAALVIAIFLHLSLGLILVIFALVVGIVIARSVSRLGAPLRAQLKAQARTGLVIGCIATIAYDLARLLLVTLFPLHVRPFETFVQFGYAILGDTVSRSTALAVGTAYHYVNGIAFAIAYCLILGGRRWLYGVAWALALEAAMLAVYPNWLDLRAVMAEFTLVSMIGHLSYGSTLGVLSQRWFQGRRLPLEVQR